jgi:very-short-patch-repair endonuclease
MKLWSGTLHTDLAIALANPRCESVGESRTSYMLWRHGVPAPVTGYEFFDERGNVLFRVDFAWPELGVFLEFDGKEKYLKYRKKGESVIDAVLREKRREEWICRLTGWRCIRIVWADLYRPEQTVARIRAVLAGGPIHV